MNRIGICDHCSEQSCGANQDQDTEDQNTGGNEAQAGD